MFTGDNPAYAKWQPEATCARDVLDAPANAHQTRRAPRRTRAYPRAVPSRQRAASARPSLSRLRVRSLYR